MPVLTNTKTPTEFANCIEACIRCAQACEECFNACLNETDVQARTSMLKMLNDCADICFQAVSMMARNSTFAKQHCELCAAICEACAVDCEKFKDAHCQECARFCRECAEACRKMAGLVAV
ncbi:four-helix bundle copper-binding protein [Ammoniphilus resinae]|uniref:Tetrahydromethanopterin S-methyltransferase subunit C n=1 Tax=Ammoniphilus resinae TaxID=861532 RepID=A0ABS4GM20_9BACL|nr:four-helix bundle copper-binding protein [Ammoniphilus resinae]MBP1931117.1 tetrahydromethanopterin S-methyltransferase subunit C [Ammoniphilus resinae]